MSESDAAGLSDRELALLSSVTDTLLPGGEGFPTASATGTPASMVQQLAPDGLERWLRPGLASIDVLAGGDFLAVDEEARTEALRRAQEEEGPFFDRLLDLAYYSYYIQPAVIAVIREMGYAYNDAPQPKGYAMDPFDPSNPEMLPAHPRGSYKKTPEVRREVMP